MNDSLNCFPFHFDIKLFYVTDLISRSEVTVEYCSTDAMVADYCTKPLVGEKFRYFRNIIMNLAQIVSAQIQKKKKWSVCQRRQVYQQECVGEEKFINLNVK